MANSNGEYVSISDGNGELFGNEIWEPNQTRFVFLKIKSNSNIRVKYSMRIDALNEDMLGAFEYVSFRGSSLDPSISQYSQIKEMYDPVLLEKVQSLLAPCGFGSFSVTTAAEHDKMIAFTSQMPHIVSNAYIKSPTAASHKGFSAGSYKDLTRVAWLKPEMWAELFLSNKENVLQELDYYIQSLQAYRDALSQNDEQTLIRLLDEGKKCKERVDK
jgi:hypothetical protein